MRLRPNRSLIDADIRAIERAPDGYGAQVALHVLHCEPDLPEPDFIAAQPGAELTAFTAIPEALRPGHRYCLEATVLGGPGGERVVIQHVRPARW
jgi:hypothetical protein